MQAKVSMSDNVSFLRER